MQTPDSKIRTVIARSLPFDDLLFSTRNVPGAAEAAAVVLTYKKIGEALMTEQTVFHMDAPPLHTRAPGRLAPL